MKGSYDQWFDDVSSTRLDNYAPPAIYIGDSRENPVVLTRQDWRHTKGKPWGKDSFGHWEIDVRTTGRYEVVVHPKEIQISGRVTVKVGTAEWTLNLDEATNKAVVPIELTQIGETQISASFFDGEKIMGPHQIYVKKMN